MGMFLLAATFKVPKSNMCSIQAVVSLLFQAKTAMAVRVQRVTSLIQKEAKPLMILRRLITLP